MVREHTTQPPSLRALTPPRYLALLPLCATRFPLRPLLPHLLLVLLATVVWLSCAAMLELKGEPYFRQVFAASCCVMIANANAFSFVCFYYIVEDSP